MSDPIALLLADVDGTLVTREKVLTDRAIRAVQGLHAKNIGFAITSGRPPKGMAMLVGPLGITHPIAAFNGGLFVHPNDLSTIEERSLPAPVARTAITLLEAHTLDVWVYRGADWFVLDRQGAHVERESWTVKFEPIVVASFDELLGDGVAKIVGVSDDFEAVAQGETDARAALGTTASASRSQPYYLDITHPDANKGAVVHRLCKMLNLSPERILTIGDQPTDVLMFRESGLSVAMGNASDAVKAQATYTTDSCDDEGFAKAVEQYLL